MTTSTPLELLTQFVSLFEESLSITGEQMRAAGINSLTLHGPNGDLLFRTTQVVEAARDLLARGRNGNAEFEITQDGEVTSRHTQPLDLAPEDVPGLPSRHGTIDPLGEDDIYEIAEKFSKRDYTHDYPATIYDIVREVERRLQEQ